MNLILLSPDDLISSQSARISDARRLTHIKNIHGAALGAQFKVGLLNGSLGSGRITTISDREVVLSLDLQQAPPPALDLTLVLALPRPEVLRRLLQTLSALGGKRTRLGSSSRVETSYWQPPFLEPTRIHDQLLLGVEQRCDSTRLPVQSR